MILETSLILGPLDLYSPAERIHGIKSATFAFASTAGVILYRIRSFLMAASLLRSFVFWDSIVWISVSNGGPGFQTLTGKRLPIVASIAACILRVGRVNVTLMDIISISSGRPSD
jgi:hypothetical protein